MLFFQTLPPISRPFRSHKRMDPRKFMFIFMYRCTSMCVKKTISILHTGNATTFRRIKDFVDSTVDNVSYTEDTQEVSCTITRYFYNSRTYSFTNIWIYCCCFLWYCSQRRGIGSLRRRYCTCFPIT